MRIFLFIAIFLTVPLRPLLSQGSFEERFERARSLEHEGRRAEAIAELKGLLAESPANNDVRIYYAQLLSYDGNYSAAIDELKQVLRSDPKNLDAYVVISHVYAWNKELRQAVDLCDAGLAIDSVNVELLLSKARALEWMAEYADAYTAVRMAMYQDPINTEAKELYERLKDKFRKNYVAVYYYNTGFDQAGMPNWHNASLEYMRRMKNVPVIARLNQAYRYRTNGYQLEIDAYPRIGKKFYAYLNAGYSPEVSLFPTYKAGAELYRSLPKGFEGSLGARLLNFNSSNTYLYTAYFGKYYRNFWFSYRPYLNMQPGKDYWSHIVSTRLYGGSADDYLTLTLSHGNIPYLIALSQDLTRTTSNRIGIDAQKKFSRGVLLKLGFNYEYEEYYPGQFRNRYNGWLGLIKRF